MIVTIDGPAGAGKSSAARLLAQRLGFEFLDTGAMFRAVTLCCLRSGTAADDENGLIRVLDGLRLEMPCGKVLINGEDVSQEIRRAEVTAASAPLAVNPMVRQRLAGWQRDLAQGRDFVCEGRDQGTVVFPDAVCKFFLMADPEVRARRRYQEMLARGETATLDEVLQAQLARDRRDAARDIAPMVPAADAILLDTSQLNLDQVVSRMETEVRAKKTLGK